MADDYLTKPFNLKELLLRVSNLIVRTQSLSNNPKNKTLFLAGCKIDLKSFVVEDNLGEKYTLTHKQIKLLKLFIERKNQVISRKEILEKNDIKTINMFLVA